MDELACTPRQRLGDALVARSGPRRSHAAARIVCASIESRSRASSSVRPTVATTRSNDGSSRDTRRRLRRRPCHRAARLRAPRRSRRRSVRPNRGRERSRADALGSRADRRRRRVDRRDARDPRRDRRRAAARDPKRRASRPRGIAEPRPRCGARRRSSPGSMPTTSRCREGSKGSSLAFARAPRAAVVGSAVMELDEAGRLGRVHAMPLGAVDVRWAALFSSPFFHPTVLVERAVLERHAFRYDTSFEESEDYDLWSRLLDVADGDNLPDPLVLYRVHPDQASQRRRELQRACQLRVAREAIARVAPGLSPDGVELAWRVGVGEPIARDRGRCCGCRVLGARWCVRAALGTRRPFASSPRPHAPGEPRLTGPRGRASPAKRCASIPSLPAHVLETAPRAPPVRTRCAVRRRACSVGSAGADASRADPGRGGVPRADALPRAAPRSRRRAIRRSTSPSSTRPEPSPGEPGAWSRSTAPSSSAASAFRGRSASSTTTIP